MPDLPTDAELVWLKETERRLAKGLPLDNREMLVELREHLPAGFKPSEINSRFLSYEGLSIEGLKATGDSESLLPDIEGAIRVIRDLLIDSPDLKKIASNEMAAALDLSELRAQTVLALVSGMGGFTSGGSGAQEGRVEINFAHDHNVAAFLGFKSLDSFLEQSAAARSTVSQPDPPLLDLGDAARGGDAFILMSMDPDDPSLLDVYNAIKEECRRFDFNAIRIDEVEHSGQITNQILRLITESDLIIADLTGERPNVYYEVGFAHALKKAPILYRRKGTTLHFDLLVHNVPEYENVTELKEKLRARLEAVLGRSGESAE